MTPFAARLIPAVLLLAACTVDMPPPVVFPPDPVGRCGAADLQGLVGQPASVLQTMRFGGPVRFDVAGMFLDALEKKTPDQSLKQTLLAQKTLRHKSKKKKFSTKF